MRKEKMSPENPEMKTKQDPLQNAESAQARRSFLGRLGLGATLVACAH
jgi:hypothetical protein